MDLLVPLGAPKPSCHAGSIEEDPMIQCDFELPEQDARGQATWIFTPNTQYTLIQVARTAQFHPEVAQQFIQSFKYLDSNDP